MHVLAFLEPFLHAPYLMGRDRSVRAGQLGEGLGSGGETGLRGKGSGRGGAAEGPGYHPSPPRRPPPPSHAPALASPQALGAAGGRRWEIRGFGGVGPGGGGGEFPPTPAWACSPPPPPPGWGWGGSAGGIPLRCEGSREPGLGVLRKEGEREEGTGWDQGRSCLPPQTPAAPACPGLSVHHSRLSRGRGGREWHLLRQTRGVRYLGTGA